MSALTPEELELKKKLSESLVEAVNNLNAAFTRLNKVETQLNLGQTASTIKLEALPSSMLDYDNLITSSFGPILDSTKLLGDRVEDMVHLIFTSIMATRAFLLVASKCKKPSDRELENLYHPIQLLIHEATELPEKSKNNKHYDLMTALSKLIPAFLWVTVNNPSSYIQQYKQLAEQLNSKFNKGRTEIVTFVDNFANFIKELDALIQKHYTNGIVWNATGKDVPNKLKFAPKGISHLLLSSQGTAKIVIENGKTYCEYQKDTKTDINAEKKQPLHISLCTGSTINIKGDTPSVTIVGCSYCKITILDNVSNVTITNGHRLELVCTGNVSLINIEKTNNCIITLSKASSDVEITSVASSELYVNLPKEDNNNSEGEGPLEIPTCIVTKTKHGKLQTSLVSTNK